MFASEVNVSAMSITIKSFMGQAILVMMKVSIFGLILKERHFIAWLF
jgi:hypothetical protein